MNSTKLKKIEQPVARTPSSQASINVDRARLFPLQKLDLPTVCGDYKDWLAFRDSFIAIIHKDNSIPKIQKLRFLKNLLKGNALRVIESLETSENNY